jgi:hypothetical protein
MRLLERHPQIDDVEITVEAEALIREAKRRERRRRIGLSLAIALVLGTIGVVVGVVGGAGTKPPSQSSSLPKSAPYFNVTAFSHQGDLAFVSRNALWVLAGNQVRRVAVPTGWSPVSPEFSADGRWLAYATTTANGLSEVWIARANGSDPRRISWLKNPSFIGWSPKGDELAVTNQSAVPSGYRNLTVERQTSLWLVSPNGGQRKLMSAAEIDGAAWSPDGAAIAVASDSAYPFRSVSWAATLVAYPINGGRPVLWLRFKTTRKLGPSRSKLILPAGWWPGWGIGFWTVYAAADDPSVLNSGGLDLWSVSAPGQSPRLLGDTLANGTLSPIVASSSGQLAFTNEPSNSGARPIWQNQQVEHCSSTTHRCANAVEPSDTVSLDPVWSPDGSKLAYVVGRSSQSGLFPQTTVARWYDSLQLWIYNASTGRSERVASVKGAVTPIWSKDGKSLLYVADDGIWLWRDLRGAPVEITAPLFPKNNWNSYFGQIHWSDQFAWSK